MVLWNAALLSVGCWLTSMDHAYSFHASHVGRAFSLPFVDNRRSYTIRSFGYGMSLHVTSATIVGEKESRNIKEDAIGAWIPIASVAALQGLGPQRVTVMGLDLVVWEDLRGSDSKTSSQWAVQTDACTHRLAPLSQGRVDPKTNCIECPYHGWQFDTNGVLTTIPQLEVGQNLDDWRRVGNLQSFPVHLAGDILFAFLPSSVHGEMFPQSFLPEDMYPSFREAVAQNYSTFVRELPYSFDFLVENFMDPAHIPFAHHSLQAVRSDARPVPMEVVVSNFSLVEVAYKHQVRGAEAEGIVSFQRPTMFHFRTLNKKTGKYVLNLNIHVVPVRAGRSRVLLTFRVATNIPKWLIHGSTNRFLNTDTWLHDAEIVARTRRSSTSTTSDNYVYATSSDGGARSFRTWWRKYGFSSAPLHTFGPAPATALRPMSRREQVDPWDAHSRQCSSCRQGLETVKKVEKGGLVLAAASAIVLKPWPLPALLVAAAGLYASWTSAKAASFVEGSPRPSGYDDRSVAHVREEGEGESKFARFVARLTAPRRKPESPGKKAEMSARRLT